LSDPLAQFDSDLADSCHRLVRELKTDCAMSKRKREPTPTFRGGLELIRLAISGVGVGGVGERGVIRGA
jgi:hypothetical protein